MRKPDSRSLISNFRRHFPCSRPLRKKDSSKSTPSVVMYFSPGSAASVMQTARACPGITNDAIRLLCSASTKSYGSCTKKTASAGALWAHTSVEVQANHEDLWRFKEREMATMRWKIESPFPFSATCNGIVYTDMPCSEYIKLRSDSRFRAVLHRHKIKKRRIQDGETTAANMKYMPKRHLECTPNTQVALKHVEAFQSMLP